MSAGAGAYVPVDRPDPPRSAMAWIGLWAAPAAWVVHIGARYPLVELACRQRAAWVLHAISISCALVAVVGLACALVAARRAYHADLPPESDFDLVSPRPPAARRVGLVRVIAGAGIVTSLVFLGSILAELVPALVHDPCTRVLAS